MEVLGKSGNGQQEGKQRGRGGGWGGGCADRAPLAAVGVEGRVQEGVLQLCCTSTPCCCWSSQWGPVCVCWETGQEVGGRCRGWWPKNASMPQDKDEDAPRTTRKAPCTFHPHYYSTTSGGVIKQAPPESVVVACTHCHTRPHPSPTTACPGTPCPPTQPSQQGRPLFLACPQLPTFAQEACRAAATAWPARGTPGCQRCAPEGTHTNSCCMAPGTAHHLFAPARNPHRCTPAC